MPEAPTVYQPTPAPSPPSHKFKWLSGQLPLILALLIIGAMLFAWKPWQAAPGASDRTITVTGEAEITAEPDEYVFQPRYEFQNADKAAALAAATDRTNEVVKQLKALGVADSKIKTDTSGGYRWYYSDDQDIYYAGITVTVNDKKLAQKVQDYLLTTTPTGDVTPQASFSKAKRKQLNDQGRAEATKDARSKADQSAANLGFKVGKVKSVKDQPDIGYFGYGTLEAGMASSAADSARSAPIQAGENNLAYKVTVTYYVR